LRVRGVGYTRTTTPQVASESNREPVGADILRLTELRLTVPQNAQSASGGSAAEMQKLPKLFLSRETQQRRANIIARKE
jgi:hypothetical protein